VPADFGKLRFSYTLCKWGLSRIKHEEKLAMIQRIMVRGVSGVVCQERRTSGKSGKFNDTQLDNWGMFTSDSFAPYLSLRFPLMTFSADKMMQTVPSKSNPTSWSFCRYNLYFRNIQKCNYLAFCASTSRIDLNKYFWRTDNLNLNAKSDFVADFFF